MEKEILCTMSPNEITVTRQVAITFTMMHQGDQDVTFINENGYTTKDIPDIDSSETLDDLTYFYFYFMYGDTPEALVDGKEDRIEFQCDSEDWDVAGGDKSESNSSYLWKICPRETIVWKAGGKGRNSELVIEFPDINCIGKVGTAYAYVKEGKEGTPIAIPIIKYHNPQIIDLKVLPNESGKQYFIGEKGWIGWTIPNHASFNISLDGVPVIQNADDHKMEVDIKYGDYSLEVVNKADTRELQSTQFQLEIIKSFSIDNLSASEAVMSWEIEVKNADRWELMGFTLTELNPKETNKPIETNTTDDRKFALMAHPKGSGEGEWVTDEKDFKMPVIDSFTVADTTVNKQKRTNCEDRLMGQDLNGFVPIGLIMADGSDEYVTPFYFTCKGGGGGPFYDHSYTWSGRNVEQYYLTVGGARNGPYDKDTTSKTIRNHDKSDSALLEAEGQYHYTVSETT